MKKYLLAFSAMSTLASVAQAQSSVTLYGLTDVGILYTNNVRTTSGGKARWAMMSGNQSGSSWGLIGAEDLGGGYQAIFRLENGFTINDGNIGQQGRMFGRQAYVGLKSSGLGTLTAGRQYTPLQDFLELIDVGTPLAGYAAHPFDNDDLSNSFRADNAVKYATPSISGARGEAMYAFSNSTSFATNRLYSFGAGYTNGPLNLGAGYVRANAPGSSLAAGGAVTSESIPNTRVDQWGVGGTYTFAPLTFELLYTGALFSNSTMALTAKSGSLHFQNYEGSVRYLVTPALNLILGEWYTTVHQAGVSGHYLQTNVGGSYLLSKRTDIYLGAFYQKASSNLMANIPFAGGNATGQSQFAVVAGIRHNF